MSSYNKQLCEVDTIIVLILQVGKLRHRDVRPEMKVGGMAGWEAEVKGLRGQVRRVLVPGGCGWDTLSQGWEARWALGSPADRGPLWAQDSTTV